ncbi:glycine C-acetyltransferase [candidate division TA06 bacterium]|uniref:2-amino-3-ketobutyrate coenzyme A ligase n=1 Tax=candidate division TA06 bacterium TaxID=2250710 RepID=A0A523UTR3_UNCT6|nr:MAG: glycine C-acetyltransferase [candidate division TA06 bacterium]
MFRKMKDDLKKELASIKEQGLWKDERVIMTPQAADIKVKTGETVINFCANNYLGLSSHPKVIEAAHKTLDTWGYGMSSVRFICGTQDIHKQLEQKIAKFLGTEDSILYAACFDANGGVFEPLFDKECAILTDALNHASVIDGIRLCKAQRFIFKHNDMKDLEEKLKEAQSAKYRVIVTDGVFSMDGDIAKLDEIVPLAEKYDALTMIDDAHATGFVGKTGRGSPEYRGVMGKIDIITGTMGKALGGASGGFTSGRKEIIDMLRQRSRPYLFSNTVAPAVVGASIAVLDLLTETTELRDKLEWNTKYFRDNMTKAGFQIRPGEHPIVPIMLGDAKLANDMARDLLDKGIYVIGFSYPVVPRGEARIRVQLSAGHEKKHLDKAIEAFTSIGRKHKVIA